MHISSRGRYGTRALLSLVQRDEGEMVSSKTVSTEQGISLKYLERLWPNLKKAGLVSSQMGALGGYSLARPAEEISMYEILTTLGEKFDIVFCTGDPEGCTRVDICKTRPLWLKLRNTIVDMLKGISLADIEDCSLIIDGESE